jgi:hypothetical protein
MTRSAHILPFDRLSPADFERLCLWLVGREGYTRVEHVGLSGNDRGLDLLAWRKGRRIGFQCKRCLRFGPAEASAAVTKVLSSQWSPDEIILIVACSVSAATRESARVQAGPTHCQIWGISELDELVNRHPDIIAHFFGADRPLENAVASAIFFIFCHFILQGELGSQKNPKFNIATMLCD